MFDLSDRVALVTGAGQGNGVGIARALAAGGAAVAVNDLYGDRARATAEGITQTGAKALAVAFDVTQAAAVEAGVARVVEALGPVDILVNNAGVPEGMGMARFRELDPAEWSRPIDLNIYGVLHCTRAVLDGMCERGFGRVITIASGAGQVGLRIGVSLYGASKAGAIGFMRHLALEVARSGVTANCLALGLMSNAVDSADSTRAIAKTIPVGRLGTPEDVGAAVVYLASNEAGWMTGQTLGLNGGTTTS